MTKKRYTILAQCFDKKGKLISEATNNYNKSHPLQAHFASLVNEPQRIYLHAEIAALLKTGDKQVHSMRIYLLNGGRNTEKLYPCNVCKKAMEIYGIDNWHFSAV